MQRASPTSIIIYFSLSIPSILYPAQSFASEPLRGSITTNQYLSPALPPVTGIPSVISLPPDTSLPPLDRRLLPGQIFDLKIATALLREEIPQNLWYKIPAWLAGTWETFAVVYDRQTDEIKHETHFARHPYKNVTKGGQGYFPTIDKNYWWNFADSECWNKIEEKQCVDWEYFQYMEPMDKEGTVKTVAIDFTINRKDNRILNVCRRSDIHTYTKISDDVVKFVDAGKEYDFNGNLVYSYFLIANMIRAADPFMSAARTTATGRNALELILSYLQDRGMQDEYNNIVNITHCSGNVQLARNHNASFH